MVMKTAIDTVLDRIFKVNTAEQAADIPEPEQLARRSEGGGRLGTQPQPFANLPPLPPETATQPEQPIFAKDYELPSNLAEPPEDQPSATWWQNFMEYYDISLPFKSLREKEQEVYSWIDREILEPAIKGIAYPFKKFGTWIYGMRQPEFREFEKSLEDVPLEERPTKRREFYAKMGPEFEKRFEELPIHQQMEHEALLYLTPLPITEAVRGVGIGIRWLRHLGKAKQLQKATEVAKVTEVAPVVDPVVEKMTGIIEAAKPARKTVEQLKSEVLKGKIPEYAGKLEEATTFKAAGEARAALRGRNIPEGADIMPRMDMISPKDEARIIEIINTTASLDKYPLTRGRVIESIEKLFAEGKLPTEGEIKLLGEVFGKGFADVLKGAVPNWAKISNVLTQIINTPKSIVASGDLGVTLRQTSFMWPRHPIKAVESTWAGFRSFWQGSYYKTLEQTIAESRFAPLREEAGLEITYAMGKLATREEAYISNWLQAVSRNWGGYPFGKKVATAPLYPLAKFVEASERAFLAISNKMRADIFDRYMALWEGKATIKEAKAMAEVINIFSGRGAIPRPIKGIIPPLNNAWFSPRLQISRAQTLGMPFLLWKYPPLVRKYVIGNIVSWVGAVGGMLAMIKMADIPDVTVETDIRSTDFAKIRVGDTRLDILGGHQQYMRLIARLLTGEMKTAKGELIEIDREQELMRFLRFKENPLVGLIHDIFRGETFLGEEMTMKQEDVKKQAEDRLIPFFIRDVIEGMQQDGLTGGLVSSTGYLGVGVVSYPSKTYADWLDYMEKKTGHEWNTEEMIQMRPAYNEAEGEWSEYLNLPSGKSREYYLNDNPEIDAGLYFWGEKRTMETPEARQIFNEMVQELDMDANLWPIRPPLDEYEQEGKSSEEMQGDYLNLVPQYWADWINANPSAFEGKDMVAEMNKIQVAKEDAQLLINEYENIVSDPNIPDDLRSRYRIVVRQARPDIDVALNIWGKATTLKSIQAIDLMKEQTELLGIPMESIPAIQKMLKPKEATVSQKTYRP